MDQRPCIAMLPCPGLSHLIPLVEFAKRLVLLHHEFRVTFLIPTLGSPTPTMNAILEALPPAIDFIILPQLNVEDLPQNVHMATQMQLAVTHSLPSVHNALSSLSSRTKLVGFLADPFSIDALDLAKQFNLLSFIYYPGSATTLSFCFSLPKLDEAVSGELADLSEPVKFPGCVAFQGKDLPEPALAKRSSQTYKAFLDVCKRLRSVDVIIMNSFTDLEPDVVRALQEKEANNPPIYPVGPIIQTGSSSQVNGSECLRWLENQPPNSVLYVSFGSGGTLSHDQLNELAFGLELSGQRFLWVVRAPNKSPASDYFNTEKENPLLYLPAGFLEKTGRQGLVMPSWAPQLEVLSHGSTGGFLTHCGWNSILESVVYGIPLIAWPLFAEQKMNATMLTDLQKVAVRPKVNENGIVERKEISKLIKSIMEGEERREIQKRMKVFKDAAAAALSEDGSSTRALSSVAIKWKNLCGM